MTEAEEFASGREDDDCHLGPTKKAELASFLEETRAPFRESDMFVTLVFQFLYLDLLSSLTSLIVSFHFLIINGCHHF
uniref:Uncharacterized protein n=1 Tax=Cannabis sativa TaxID=3483 RepID=A0A803QVL9_CANSA